MEDLEIVWEGHVVGWLKDADFETVNLFQGSKIEGEFLFADGAIATEFRRRLDAHDTIDVLAANRPSVLYWRAGGRAKLWSPMKPPWEDEGA